MNANSKGCRKRKPTGAPLHQDQTGKNLMQAEEKT